MTPALKYIQRSQRTSVHFTNSDSEEKPPDAMPRRVSPQLSVSDNRDQVEDDVSDLVGPNVQNVASMIYHLAFVLLNCFFLPPCTTPPFILRVFGVCYGTSIPCTLAHFV